MHFKATPPDKNRRPVVFADSLEVRAFKNTIADLRRSGFVWPPKNERVTEGDAPRIVAGVDVSVREGEEDVVSFAAGPGAVVPSIPAPPLEVPALPIDELNAAAPDVDALWRDLKDARTELALVIEFVGECEQRLEVARQALERAKRDREIVTTRLLDLKSRLDQEFKIPA